MEKTIKYLENGEYHYATVKDVGDLAKLKTDSKDDLVTAINDLFENGGKNAGKPEGYDKLVDQMADTIKKQQDISGKLNSAENDLKQKIADSNSSNRTITDELNAQIEVERQKVEALRLAAEQARKELNEQVAKLNADSQELSKKTTDLANDVENKFGSIQNDYKTVSENLTNEAAALHKQLGDVKNEAETTKSRIQDQAEDIGNIHKTVDNVSNQVTQKIWMTDLDPVKQQVTQNSTEVQETQNQLKTKAEQSSLDLVANSVEKLDTEVKKNSEGLEVTVKKEEFAEDVAKLLKDKTNLLLGTRNFAGDKWSNLAHWHEEPGYWNGLKVYSSTSDWYGIQYQYEVKKGNQYTFSFYARQQSENNSAYIVLSEGSTGAHLACTEPYQKSDIHIGTEWKRYSLTFQAIADGTIYPRVEQSVTNNTIYVAGYKLELGKVATPWEPNEADVADNIERNESKFNVFSDKIEGVVKKQEQFGSSQTEIETKVTQNAEGLKQASHQLEDANGKINKFQGDLESTAKGLKASYEEYTNKAIGQISDSSLNLIRNGSFSNKDSDFAQWQNVSAKANIREDDNGLRWIELTQSGMTTDNPQGITSNYFVIKQGKVTVAVDIKLGDKANLDNQNILLLELYNDNKQRVDFTDVSVSQLGLSTAILNDHNVHRGLYRLGIDRQDVKYMTVKAILHRNGDLWFTNFSARLSSIDDGAYEPNPDDLNQQILKQNTKIEQNAKEVAIKANSVDVTRDIKSAVDGIQVGTSNLLHHSDTFEGWTKGGSVTVTSDKYLDGRIAVLGGAGVNGGQLTTHLDGPYNDELVTWVVYAKADNAGDKMHTELWGGGGYTDQSLTTQWQAYKFSGHRNINHPDIFYLWGCVGNKGNIYVALPFAVVGNKVGTWSPNPQDTAAEIKSAKDAAIQVASDQINIKTNELTTKYNESLNQRINESKSASEKFTSDQIVQTVKKITDVQGNVDKLDQLVKSNNGGGINLLKGTANFRPDDIWFPLGAWTRTSEKYNGLTVFKVHVDENWNGLTQYYPVKAGETYTFSLNARYESGNGKSSFYIELNDPQQEAGHNHAHVSPSSQSVLLTEDWNRYSITFTVNSDGYIKPRIERDNFNKNILEICGFKLEKGSVATPWTPAPEDAESTYSTLREEIKSSKEAAIKVASDNVQIKVNELSTTLNDSFNQKINEAKEASQKFTSDGIEQTVRKITDVQNNVNNLNEKVDSNNGGGINLLKATDFSSESMERLRKFWGSGFTLRDNCAMQVDARGLTGNVDVLQEVPVEPDTDYTLSYEVHYSEIAEGGHWNAIQTFLWEFDESGHTTKKYTDNARSVVNTNKRKDNIYTIHTQPDCHYLKVIFRANAKTLFSFVKPKLERGNTATPWTVSPEDTAQSITNTNKKIDTQTLDSANIDQMKTQGHYFVHSLTGNPLGSGWVYVDVIGNNSDRIRQDVYQDNGSKHMYRRLFGTSWSGWEQGAYLSDVNAAKTEVTASVKNLGDRVTTEVNSITSKVNSNNGGGINLQVGTDDCSFPIGNNGHEVNIENYSGTTKMIHSQNGGFYTDWSNKTFVPTVGETYTISADVKGDGTLDSNGFRYEGGTNAEFKIITLSDKWQRFSNTVKVDKISGQWVIYPANSKNLYVKHIKIERGTVATPWSPAPEDANEAINSLNTKWDVANGQIQGKVTEIQVQDLLNRGHYATQEWSQGQINLTKDQFNVDIKKVTSDLNSRVNEVKTASEKFTSDGIEQTVRKITDVKNQVDDVNDKVNNLKVGGRNLLTNTNKDISVTSHTTDGYPAWAFVKTTFIFEHGKTYTFSTEARNSTNKVTEASIRVFDGSTNTQVGIYAFPADGNRHSVTFTVPNDNHNYYLYYYAGHAGINPGVDVTTTYHHPKLELGNMATDWTPAPEDVDSKFQYKEVTGAIDFNDLKTQQKIFYKDTQARNSPAGGTYWYFVDVDVEPGSARIVQTATSDRNNITWKRTFDGSWTAWQKQATQGDVDALRTETTASVKNLGDRVTTEVNSIETRVDGIQIGGRNLAVGTDKDIVIDDTNNTGTQGWCFVIIHLAEQPKLGDQITISAEGVLTGNGHLDDYTVILYNETTTDARSVQGRLKPGQRSSVTVKVDNLNGTGDTVLLIYAGNPSDTQGKKNVVHHLKIEKGNKPTEWSLAPEDTLEAIKEVNTKWDVANGQIQGKVTATDVNNILNGKGYATQSWAQTMFTMKSDAITLQAVRDNITNGIQNQVNSLQGKLDGDLSNLCHNPTFSHGLEGWNSSHLAVEGPWSEMPTPKNGTLFVRDAYYGDYFPVSKGERYYTSVFAHNGDSATFVLGLCFQLKDGSLSWLSGSNVPGLQTGKFDGYVDVPDNAVSAKIWVSIQKFDNFGWVRFTNVVVKKNDAISQINITPDQVKIASNKIEIDGNTYIHGTLNVPEVKLQGKKGLVNLAGDSGLELLSNDGNKVEVGSSGIKLSSGMTKDLNSYVKESGFSLNVDSRGMRLTNTLTIQGRMNGTSDYNFLKLEPGVLSDSNNQIPSGTIAYVPNNYSRELGPESPGGFFALGREDVDTNGDLIQRRSEVAYVTKSTDGWDQGFTIKAPFFIQPPDANHGIRATWVSWSQWDWGERYPALVNNTTNWGGICFPSSGRVTLFDSKGKYYTPDKDTGIGPYDNYGQK